MHCSTLNLPITSGLHLIFTRHQTQYALPLPTVKEVVCLPELVSIENMPNHIVGIFNYHGQLVPVMNLDSSLGHVSFRYKISDNVILVEWDGFICGLIVDETRDLLDIRPEEMELESSPEIKPGQPNPLIAHVVPHNDGAINVMHPLPVSQDRVVIQQFIQNISESGNDGQLNDAQNLIRGMTLLEQSLMRERTMDLRESDKEDLSEHTQLVVIRIKEEYFGVDLGLIRECVEFQSVHIIPGCPEFVVGVINVRGEVLPIVDMRATLDVPIDKSENFHKAVVVQFENIFVGIVVEEIIESIFLQASDMMSGSLTGSVKEEGYVRGIAQFHDQKFLKVLDLQKLLMNGELTVDQTFSQVASDHQQTVSEDRVKPSVGEVNELHTIFMRESKESLRDLRQSIMNLREMLSATGEKAEDCGRVELQRAFNQSHFLMSVARMLGARKMEIVARRVEDLLRVAKRGQNVVTLKLVDHLDRGVNGVQTLLDEFTTEATTTDIDPLDFLDERALVEAGMTHEPMQERLDEETTQRDHAGALLVESARLDELMVLIEDLKAIICGRQGCLVDTAHLVEFSDSWSHAVFEYRAIGFKGTRSRKLMARDDMAKFYKQESEQLTALTGVVGRVARTVADEHQRLSSISETLEEHIRSMRLLTFSSFFQDLPKTASDIGRQLRKEVELSIEGGHMTVDMQVLEELKEPLRHLIRNAIQHGIESPSERIQAGKPQKGALRLYVFQMGTYLLIELWDDGRGLDLEAIKQAAVQDQLFTSEELEAMPLPQIESLVFKPGFSTGSSLQGTSQGMGLDVVQSAVKHLKGAVYAGSTPGSGCMIQIQLPGPMPPIHLLIVSMAGQKYGISIDHVQTTTQTTHSNAKGSQNSKNQEFVTEDGQVVPLVSLADLLEVEGQCRPDELCPCVVMVVDGKPLGCLVDEILFEQEVKPQPQGLILKRVRNVSGSTILNTGEVCLILNPDDLIRTAEKNLAVSRST